MEIINELIKELSELQEYKKKYEHAMADKKKSAEYVYKNELEKYSKESYEERQARYKEEKCKDCWLYGSCNIKLPDDILKPIENEGWFPGYKGCNSFEWS